MLKLVPGLGVGSILQNTNTGPLFVTVEPPRYYSYLSGGTPLGKEKEVALIPLN